MDRGGLGIGSLASLNLALLQKWRWRFYNEKEALWCRVIKAIHGEDGGISKREDQRIKKDSWMEEKPFCVRFNRLFTLELDPNCKVCERWGDGGWIWNWRRVVRGGIEQEQGRK
ncbi:hypothetical protein Tco_0639706 [Tanacetum coccineum]